MYDALNRAVTMVYGNTATQRNEFNNAGWQTVERHAKGDGTVLAALTYSYDNVGNRNALHEQNGDRVTWSYDTTYQLTREQRSGANASDFTYAYDAVANRATKLQSGNPGSDWHGDEINSLFTVNFANLCIRAVATGD